MTKQNTSKIPPMRSLVVTIIQTKASRSTVKPVENQTIVPATPVTEHENRRPEIIFILPTRGPMNLDNLRKITQDITVKV